MKIQTVFQRRWVWWILVFAVWTALALVDIGQGYFHWCLIMGKSLDWWRVVGIGCIDWYVWAALTPAVVWLARRFSFRDGRWPLRLLLHLAASVCFALLVMALCTPVVAALSNPLIMTCTGWELLERIFITKLHLYVLIYWIILSVSHALTYYHQYRLRQLVAAHLEAKLAQAQLQVLKMQLDPHFLFNTLNAISALMHQDVELADRMIARLGDLLRLTLENAGAQEVALGQELEFIEPYLEIQKARLGSRLAVRFDIDPQTRSARVPNLVLQPLVENAIRHGVAPRPAGGRVEVRSRRQDGMLCLEVRDDGPGLPGVERGGYKEGVGLANTRARLRHLYGPRHRLEMRNGAVPASLPGPGRGEGKHGGLVVSLTIPFRTDKGKGAAQEGSIS
jgi:hypothetical protein